MDGERAQEFGALAEDPDLVPGNHVAWPIVSFLEGVPCFSQTFRRFPHKPAHKCLLVEPSDITVSLEDKKMLSALIWGVSLKI